MTWFVVRRLIAMVITLWVIFTLTWLLMRAVPGGPYSRERKLPKATEEAYKRRYNLDLPRSQQYVEELKRVAVGNLGLPFKLNDFTVNRVIAQGWPISAALGILALTFAMLLGLTAGIVSAASRGSPADLVLMTMATFGIAVPSFIIASLAILVFVFLIPVFPAGGWGTLRQLVLPAMCLGAPYAAEIARITRTGMLDTLSQDYIRTARAKGLGETAVVLRHALPGAMLPVVSFLGPATAGILTGSVVIEKMFAIPGLGWHLVQAALQRDFTLEMGLVLLYTVLLFTMNFIVDVSYAILDPRVELK
ncbi:MAG: ABC transporter permease [Pirellulales bacterium]